MTFCKLGNIYIFLRMRFSFRNVARIELDEAEAGKRTGIAILSFISVVTLIFYFFVKNALAVIRVS